MNRQWRGVGGRALVDRGLRMQNRIFFGIFIVMLALVVARIIGDDVNPLLPLVGFGVGLIIGVVLARVKVLGWSASKRTVVGTTDLVGGVILVAYLVFLVFRNRMIGGVVRDAAPVEVMVLAMTGGAMLGRVRATLRGIRRVLAAAGIGLSESP